MNSVEVSHVSKSFEGEAVVRDLSFDVRAGEVFGLLGPNGAGKTTVIRMLLDIVCDSGRITVLNRSSSESFL